MIHINLTEMKLLRYVIGGAHLIMINYSDIRNDLHVFDITNKRITQTEVDRKSL
jgi:hypothetical protein